MNDELDFNLEDYETEEESLNLDNIPNKPQVSTEKVETKQVSSKLSEVEDRLNKITSMLETGKKTSHLDRLLSKYENVDPVFKQMLIDMNMANNEFTKDNLKQIHGFFDELKNDLIATKEKLQAVESYADSINNMVTTNKVVRKSLESAFKKSSVKEVHIEEAIKEHTKRLQKDSAYYLEFSKIWNTDGLTIADKNRLSGELIKKNFIEVAAKKRGKSKEEAPEMKQRVEKDPLLEKSIKKMDKLQDKEEEVEVIPQTDPEESKRRVARFLKNI
jgi:hypothetical protein